MVRNYWLVVVILFFFLLTGCSFEKKQLGQGITVNGTVELNQTVPEESPLFPATSECTPGWKCVGKYYKAYQEAHCNWSQKKECPLGCLNGTCQAAPTCLSGFRCKNAWTEGHQLEDCTWKSENECLWGCAEGECKEAPPNATAYGNRTPEAPLPTTLEETEATATPLSTSNWRTLGYGQVDVVTRGSTTHNLSIYIIEGGRVRLTLDGFNSDWMEDGGNYTFYDGLKVFVQEILFQPYQSGAKSIRYTIE